ncbi:perforin-1-like [Tiliqua scincoides]|uniref:perforin-1-like n=1 Tax=Tiliqua scincoides TaxID=71010 RepID=UPI003461E1A4
MTWHLMGVSFLPGGSQAGTQRSTGLQRLMEASAPASSKCLVLAWICQRKDERFRIIKNKSVSAKFMNNVKILPEKLDSHSKWGYNQLILRYGTHFMKEPDLGARVNYMTGIEACRIPLTNYTISEIRRCLEIEAGVHIGFDEMTKNPDFHKCKHKRTDMAFLFLVSKYIKDLEGGRTSNSDLSDEAFNFPESSKRWLESVKTLPALLSSSIEPLHTLLDKNDPRRENLRQVVSEHVRRQVLLRNCTLLCPPGVQQSVWEPCSCECPSNNFTNTMCCSQQQGLGKLTMTIQRAESLWGDFFTHSDGYVSVSLQNKEMCTHTVWNNNNPEWNTSMDFGIVKLTGDFTKVKIEVWDEDSGWNDDLLGRCLMTLRPWETFQHVCRLNHGSLHYKGRLVCGYHLGGPSCRDYIPLWPKERKKNSQHMGKAER